MANEVDWKTAYRKSSPEHRVAFNLYIEKQLAKRLHAGQERGAIDSSFAEADKLREKIMRDSLLRNQIIILHEDLVKERWREHRDLLEIGRGSGPPEKDDDLIPAAHEAVDWAVGKLASDWMAEHVGTKDSAKAIYEYLEFKKYAFWADPDGIKELMVLHDAEKKKAAQKAASSGWVAREEDRGGSPFRS